MLGCYFDSLSCACIAATYQISAVSKKIRSSFSTFLCFGSSFCSSLDLSALGDCHGDCAGVQACDAEGDRYGAKSSETACSDGRCCAGCCSGCFSRAPSSSLLGDRPFGMSGPGRATPPPPLSRGDDGLFEPLNTTLEPMAPPKLALRLRGDDGAEPMKEI